MSATGDGPVIVGVSASHSASACVLVGGALVAAVQLERITRHKRDGRGFLHSGQAIEYVLRAAGLRPADVDVYAFNSLPLLPGYVGLSLPVADRDFTSFDPFGPRAVYVSHHLAHAASAFVTSSFRTAAVLVVDGSGGATPAGGDLVLTGPELFDYVNSSLAEYPAAHVRSTYRFDEGGYQLLGREFAPTFNARSGSSSLGETYAAVSQYIFGDWQDGGKVMGLAPYGDAARFGPSLLHRDAEGRLAYTAGWKLREAAALAAADPMAHRDLAARVQQDVEEALLERARESLTDTGERDLAFAGGLALNSRANQRIALESGCRGFHVPTAANDAGVSVGAAAVAHFRLTGGTTRRPPRHDFLGYRYTPSDCRDALAGLADRLSIEPLDIPAVATRLAEGEVFGWFEGAAEFGLRALGHRSLLADPRSPAMWQHINRRIKYREDFRPFAPAVPRERAAEFFDLDVASPYMQRVVPVRPAARHLLGAVTHADGTARVQTVDRTVLTRLHHLLTAFGKLTGVPVLLNTSMNVAGQPIVETPREAVELLLSTNLDALVLGDVVVTPVRASKAVPHRIVLAPGVRISAEVEGGRERYVLRSANQRREHPVSRSLFEALRPGADAPADAATRKALEALTALRLANVVSDGSPHGAAPDGGDIASEPAGAAEAVVPEALPGRAATPARAAGRDPEAAARLFDRVWMRRGQLGITRLADLDGYDYVGIPVAGATRPDVSDDDVTASTGKGITALLARTGALLEAVEWHALATARPGALASVRQLRDAGTGALTTRDLGGRLGPDKPIEWVPGYLWPDREPVHVPAAVTLFPYTPPAGSPAVWVPGTTGAAAGDTADEAILYGLLEVIERDAVSRFAEGGQASVLAATGLGEPERELFEALSRGGAEVLMFDLSALAAVPVVLAATFDLMAPLPRMPLVGHAARPDLCGAVQGALLELAQARVVALQGSREDFDRHTQVWSQDAPGAQQSWTEWQDLAARLPASTTPRRRQLPGVAADQVAAIAAQLSRRGLSDIAICDLTSPAIGVPVVSVVVPGLANTRVDPARSRREYVR